MKIFIFTQQWGKNKAATRGPGSDSDSGGEKEEEEELGSEVGAKRKRMRRCQCWPIYKLHFSTFSHKLRQIKVA